MTEEEWLILHPALMMRQIKQVAPATSRKLRLLAVAYAHYLESQPDYADAKHVSHLGEEVLEGRQTLDFLWDDSQRGWGYQGDWSIANLVLAGDDNLDGKVRSAFVFSVDRGQRAGLDVSERPMVARALVLCILANPFRPIALDPSWLTSNVLSLAQGIYHERAFDRLPILADALQDAGCENPEILAHCRSESPHARGCWVVDLLLGKY